MSRISRKCMIDGEEQYYCPVCKCYHKRNEFYSNKKLKHGIDSMCKKSRNSYTKYGCMIDNEKQLKDLNEIPDMKDILRKIDSYIDIKDKEKKKEVFKKIYLQSHGLLILPYEYRIGKKELNF